MTIKKSSSGVALIVVLGLVAILMIVSVTFTIHMRVERAGAANLRHAAIARQVVKGGLAAALMAIDKQAGISSIPEWYDPNDITSLTYRPFSKFRDGTTDVEGYLWRDTFVSFNTNNLISGEDSYVRNNRHTHNKKVSGGVNAQIFSDEVARYFPSGLAYRGYATAFSPPGNNDGSKWRPIIQPQWQPVFSDTDNDNVMGRYAFFVLNTTCLLDASCMTNSTSARWMGRYPGEMDVSLPNQDLGFLSDVKNAKEFAKKNFDNGTYETLAEFNVLNPHVSACRSFNTLSYDPGAIEDLIYIGGSADEIRGRKAEIIEAFYDCGLTAGKKYGDKDCEQARWAYLGLVDYVDKDGEMEPDDKVKTWERPVTERMPLLSGFFGELTIAARQTCTKSEDDAGFNFDKTPVQVKISAKVKVPFVFPFMPDLETEADKENLKLEGKAALVVNSNSKSLASEIKTLSISTTDFGMEYVISSLQLDEGDDGWVDVVKQPKNGQFNAPIDEQLELPGVEAKLRVGGATYCNGKVQHCFPVKEDYYNDFDEEEIGMFIRFIPKDEGVKFDSDAAGGTPSPPDENKKVTWVRTWETNIFVWAEIVDPRFANRSMAQNADVDEGIMMANCKVSHGTLDPGLHGIPLSKIRKESTRLPAFSGFSDAEVILAMSASQACGSWQGTDDYGKYFNGHYGTMQGTSPFTSYLLTHPKAVEALYGMPMDGIQAGTDKGSTDEAWPKYRMFVKNAPLESVGELGYLPVGMWQTIRLYDYCDDFGDPDTTKTVAELYNFNKLPKYKTIPGDTLYGFFHPVLDYFTVVPKYETVQGRVNINATDKEILAVAFHNMPVMTEDGNRGPGKVERIDRVKKGEKPSREDLPSLTCLAEAIVAHRGKVKRSIKKLSELGYLFRYGDVESPLLYGTEDDDLSHPAWAVQKAMNLTVKNTALWGEWEREAVIRNSCGLFTMRGQSFIVVVRGESYSAPFGRKKSMQGGTSNSSKTAIANVWRDSIPQNYDEIEAYIEKQNLTGKAADDYRRTHGRYPMYVQFFKIIDD